MKLARVNNTGGNMVLDRVSQGAQGVSMPTTSVNKAAIAVANTPIERSVLVDAFNAVRWAVIMAEGQRHFRGIFLFASVFARKYFRSDIY